MTTPLCQELLDLINDQNVVQLTNQQLAMYQPIINEEHGDYYTSPMYLAIHRNKLVILRQLLSSGGNPNLQTNSNNLLQFSDTKLECLRMFIEFGPTPAFINKTLNMLVLHNNWMRIDPVNYMRCIELLIEHTPKNTFNPRYIFALPQSNPVFKLAINKGIVDFSQQNIDTNPAVFYYVKMKKFEEEIKNYKNAHKLITSFSLLI